MLELTEPIDYNLMVRYIENTLSPEDKTLYEQKIAENENLRATIDYFRTLSQTIAKTVESEGSPPLRSPGNPEIKKRPPSVFGVGSD